MVLTGSVLDAIRHVVVVMKLVMVMVRSCEAETKKYMERGKKWCLSSLEITLVALKLVAT